jgi:putative membrane protein
MKMRLAAVAVLSLAFAGAARAADDVAQNAAFSDPEIVGALQAADQGEVDAANIAQDKASRSDVKKFADKMKREHGEHQQKLTTLASDANISAADSEFTTGLRRHAEEMNGSLRPLAGADFDRAYIDGMVADHQALLDSLDQRMIPSAKDGKLKAEVRRTRGVVAEHLREARRIQGRIAGNKNSDDRERAVGPQEGRYPENGRFYDPSKPEEVHQP